MRHFLLGALLCGLVLWALTGFRGLSRPPITFITTGSGATSVALAATSADAAPPAATAAPTAAPPPTAVPTATPDPITPGEVVEAVATGAKLVSVEWAIDTEVTVEAAGLVWGTRTLRMQVGGTLQAGVDLRRITADRVRIASDGTITVELPPVQLIGAVLDANRTHVEGSNFDAWAATLRPEAQQAARDKGLDAIRARACANGIVGLTEATAAADMVRLLKLAGHERVYVTNARSDLCTS